MSKFSADLPQSIHTRGYPSKPPILYNRFGHEMKISTISNFLSGNTDGDSTTAPKPTKQICFENFKTILPAEFNDSFVKLLEF